MEVLKKDFGHKSSNHARNLIYRCGRQETNRILRHHRRCGDVDAVRNVFHHYREKTTVPHVHPQVPQRVGMWMNAKHSETVYNNIPLNSHLRRKVACDIDTICANDSDSTHGFWSKAPPAHAVEAKSRLASETICETKLAGTSLMDRDAHQKRHGESDVEKLLGSRSDSEYDLALDPDFVVENPLNGKPTVLFPSDPDLVEISQRILVPLPHIYLKCGSSSSYMPVATHLLTSAWKEKASMNFRSENASVSFLETPNIYNETTPFDVSTSEAVKLSRCLRKSPPSSFQMRQESFDSTMELSKIFPFDADADSSISFTEQFNISGSNEFSHKFPTGTISAKDAFGFSIDSSHSSSTGSLFSVEPTINNSALNTTDSTVISSRHEANNPVFDHPTMNSASNYKFEASAAKITNAVFRDSVGNASAFERSETLGPLSSFANLKANVGEHREISEAVDKQNVISFEQLLNQWE
ncbi:hypothetical protein AB6A40_004101 [Gnathostoma spinigerum]|uniref:Uncharacterized protein n=1 Tax=Gnathostoma spinigerum TaxID=75299 RepID=A0ABD6ELE1_9BILA